MVMSERRYAIKTMTPLTKEQTAQHYQDLLDDSHRCLGPCRQVLEVTHLRTNGIVEWYLCSEPDAKCNSVAEVAAWAADRERGSVSLPIATVLFGIVGTVLVLILLAYGAVMAHNTTPHSAQSVRLQHDLGVCRQSFTDCHIEVDSDGSRSVYGGMPRHGVVTTPNAPGYVSTTNTPDGLCHEDDACWIAP